jgi:hypothetical protein
MADALDWLRKNDTVLDPLDGPSAISSYSKASNRASTPLVEEREVRPWNAPWIGFGVAISRLKSLTMQRSPRSVLRAQIRGFSDRFKNVLTEDKDRVFGDVSDWLRNRLLNRSRDPKGLDDGILESIAEVAGLDMPMAEYKPFDKERTRKDTADWLRHNDLVPNTVDDATLRALANMVGVELHCAKCLHSRRKSSLILILAGCV